MRTVDEQHTMLELAMEEVTRAAETQPLPRESGEVWAARREDKTRAAVRNQEVQALTSIALELREVRLLMAENAAVNGPGLFAQAQRGRSHVVASTDGRTVHHNHALEDICSSACPAFVQ